MTPPSPDCSASPRRLVLNRFAVDWGGAAFGRANCDNAAFLQRRVRIARHTRSIEYP
jgi:hypothetical protein